MAFDYAAKRAMANKAIIKFGRSITIRRMTRASFNSTTGKYGTESSTDYTAYAAVLPATSGAINAHDIRFANDTLIESNMRSLLISSQDLAITPEPGDLVIIDSVTWKIIGNNPLAPGGTAVIHRVTIERGI